MALHPAELPSGDRIYSSTQNIALEISSGPAGRLSPRTLHYFCSFVFFVSILTCSALAQSVTLSPTSANFFSVALGSSSSAKTFTLKNGQSGALTISSVSASGDYQIQTSNCPMSPTSLASGMSCTVIVVFTPTAVGVRSGTLAVADDATSSPQTASLTGTGIAAVTITPSTLSFGNVPVGSTSASKTATVKNQQKIALTISSVTISGDYQIQANNCPISPATLAPSTTCTVSAVFQPTTSGTRAGTLTVNDSASTSPQSEKLTGTGVVLKTITVTPAAPSIAKGSSQQFAATGKYSDGSTHDLTTVATWSSSNTAVANISNSPGSQGLATSVASGTSTITATYNGISGSTTLTVSPPALLSLALTPASGSIALGTTQQFTATGTFSDGSTQTLTTTVTWTSSASSVATISNTSGSQGLATSVGTGTATITATSGSVSGTTTLTVTLAGLVSIAVTPATPSIAMGTQKQFTATGTFTDNSTQDITKTVVWSSSTATVATISNTSGSQGLGNSIGIGTSTITATSGAISGSTTLTVTAAILVSISVSPATASIVPGSTQQFTAMGTFSDGSAQNLSSSAIWSSSNTTIATVNSAGLTTAIAAGTTNISATSGTVVGSASLTVEALVSIAISPTSPSIALGTAQQFTATGTFSDGGTQDMTSSVNWTSSSAGVATISGSAPTVGLASSTGIGSTTITATSGQISGSATLTVTPAGLMSISVTPLNPSIALGTTQQFTATGTYTDGTSQDITNSVAWNSSSAAVAVISNSTGSFGLATSAGQGSTTITATSGSLSSSTTLVVGVPQLVSLAVTPANPGIAQGSTQQFTATGTFTDGSSQNLTTSVSWTSSNTAVATINGTGLASGVGGGTTTIKAASGSINNSTTLTVTTGVAVLTSLAIFPLNPSAQVGAKEQFTATGIYSDGSTQVLTSQATWTTSSSTVATMQAGVATAVTPGSTTITATYSGFTISTTLSVIAATRFDAVPLMDMPQADGSCLTYLSFQGGLYENCSDNVPSNHNADGMSFTSQVQPLDINGNPSATGQIVFISTGHSVAADDFGAFVTSAQANSSVNSKTMALSNSALSNQTACYWFPAFGPPSCDVSVQNNYDRIAANMATRGISPLQVQVVWTENNNGRSHADSRGCLPIGTLCVPLCDPTVPGCVNTTNNTDALNIAWELGNMLRAAKQRWPNLKLAFFTSRNYGGYAPPGGSDPEAYSYEAGLSVKWLIQAQINQMRTGIVDAIAGDLNYNNGTVPWVAWGPYFWADGPNPRSDGLVWCFGTATPGPPCNGAQDYEIDGQHPLGEKKQVNMLMNFFLNSPYTQPWFAAH